MEDLLYNRRSIRKYTNQDIPQELLCDMLTLASRTSTTGNMQVYSVVATRDKEIKQQLLGCHFNQPMITNAPVVLTFCADFNRFNKWCELRNAEPGYDNFLSFMTATIDALLVAQTFSLIAESKGLGICYLGTTTYLAEKIIDVLKLPKFVVPITTITVGYPGEVPAQVDRLPIEAILHNDVYSDYTDEKINQIYAYKESLIENKKFVEENKKESLAQVFTDIRYSKKDNELFSKMLLNVIKKQGFKFPDETI